MKVTNLFTEKDREAFDRIDRDCIAMHVPTPPKTFLRLDVVGPDGEPLETYADRAHSWVRNAYNGIFVRGFNSQSGQVDGNPPYGEGALIGKKSDGGTENIPEMSIYAPSAGVGVANSGIIVGSGDSAESFESFALSARILSGSTANTLLYGQMTRALPTYEPVSKKWSVVYSRVFNNNSGAVITVKEVGICQSNSSLYFMTCRDVLASPVTVPNAGQLTVTYTIEMTFPA